MINPPPQKSLLTDKMSFRREGEVRRRNDTHFKVVVYITQKKGLKTTDQNRIIKPLLDSVYHSALEKDNL